MKRRTFLSTTGTIGLVSVTSSATVASSVYNSVSTSVLLQEFDKSFKNILDKFVADILDNSKSLELNSNFAKRIAMPVQIIDNKSTKEGRSLTYRNKAGQYILLSIKDDSGSVKILKDL